MGPWCRSTLKVYCCIWFHSSLQGLHAMQPPSRVVHNSSMCSLTLTQLSVLMQPNNPETTPLVLQHVQVVLLACLVVSLLSSVQPNQANKRVNFQLEIKSYLSRSQDIREHMICSNAALLLHSLWHAGRFARMRVTRKVNGVKMM